MYRANRMTPWLKALLTSIVAVFAPIKPMLITVGVLVAADLVFGLMASYKSKIPISSSVMRRTISKSLVYMSAVCLGFLLQHYLMGDILAVSKLIAGTIGLVEMKSILENADIINGGSVFKTIIAKLGSTNDDLQK